MRGQEANYEGGIGIERILNKVEITLEDWLKNMKKWGIKPSIEVAEITPYKVTLKVRGFNDYTVYIYSDDHVELRKNTKKPLNLEARAELKFLESWVAEYNNLKLKEGEEMFINYDRENDMLYIELEEGKRFKAPKQLIDKIDSL